MTIKSASVIVTRFKESDELIEKSLTALSLSTNIFLEVLFLDQSPSGKIKERCYQLSSDRIKFLYFPIKASSASQARNQGIQRSSEDILFFVDADVVVDPDWAEILCSELESDEHVGIVGGKVLPCWHGSRPWWTHSSIILEQYSIIDLGEISKNVSKLFTAGIGFYRSRIGQQAYFKEGYSRENDRLDGGEDVDLCDRVRSLGLFVRYIPNARAYHQILPERLTLRWISKRIYYAGRGRSLSGGFPSPVQKKRNFGDFYFFLFFLPIYLMGYFFSKK